MGPTVKLAVLLLLHLLVVVPTVRTGITPPATPAAPAAPTHSPPLSTPGPPTHALRTIIFTRDRAAQLDLLLRSMDTHFPDWRDPDRARHTIVACATTVAFLDGYLQLRARRARAFPGVRPLHFVWERNTTAGCIGGDPLKAAPAPLAALTTGPLPPSSPEEANAGRGGIAETGIDGETRFDEVVLGAMAEHPPVAAGASARNWAGHVAPLTLLIVDDQVFRAPVTVGDMEEALAQHQDVVAVSLHMWPGITQVYMQYGDDDSTATPSDLAPLNRGGLTASASATADATADAAVAAAPAAITGGADHNDGPGLMTWDWSVATKDWAYPMSVAGSFFRTADLWQVMTTVRGWHNPNLLELGMSHWYVPSLLGHPPLSTRHTLACFPTARIIGMHMNRVQEVFPNNRHMGSSAGGVGKGEAKGGAGGKAGEGARGGGRQSSSASGDDVEDGTRGSGNYSSGARIGDSSGDSGSDSSGQGGGDALQRQLSVAELNRNFLAGRQLRVPTPSETQHNSAAIDLWPGWEREGVGGPSPCRVVVDGSEYLPLGAHALLDTTTARQKAGQFCAEQNIGDNTCPAQIMAHCSSHVAELPPRCDAGEGRDGVCSTDGGSITMVVPVLAQGTKRRRQEMTYRGFPLPNLLLATTHPIPLGVDGHQFVFHAPLPHPDHHRSHRELLLDGARKFCMLHSIGDGQSCPESLVAAAANAIAQAPPARVHVRAPTTSTLGVSPSSDATAAADGSPCVAWESRYTQLCEVEAYLDPAILEVLAYKTMRSIKDCIDLWHAAAVTTGDGSNTNGRGNKLSTTKNTLREDVDVQQMTVNYAALMLDGVFRHSVSGVLFNEATGVSEAATALQRVWKLRTASRQQRDDGEIEEPIAEAATEEADEEGHETVGRALSEVLTLGSKHAEAWKVINPLFQHARERAQKRHKLLVNTTAQGAVDGGEGETSVSEEETLEACLPPKLTSVWGKALLRRKQHYSDEESRAPGGKWRAALFEAIDLIEGQMKQRPALSDQYDGGQRALNSYMYCSGWSPLNTTLHRAEVHSVLARMYGALSMHDRSFNHWKLHARIRSALEGIVRAWDDDRREEQSLPATNGGKGIEWGAAYTSRFLRNTAAAFSRDRIAEMWRRRMAWRRHRQQRHGETFADGGGERVIGGGEGEGGHMDTSRYTGRADPSDTTVVFVTGLSRSGTSLMEAMLSKHPEVQALGEIPSLWRMAPELIDIQGAAGRGGGGGEVTYGGEERAGDGNEGSLCARGTVAWRSAWNAVTSNKEVSNSGANGGSGSNTMPRQERQGGEALLPAIFRGLLSTDSEEVDRTNRRLDRIGARFEETLRRKSVQLDRSQLRVSENEREKTKNMLTDDEKGEEKSRDRDDGQQGVSTRRYRFLTTKLPEHGWMMGALRLVLPTARIVDMERGLRDVALSNFETVYDVGTMPWTWDLVDLAHVVSGHARLMRHWGAVLPPWSTAGARKLGASTGRGGIQSLHTVSYEELVRSPLKELGRVFDYLGLDPHGEGNVCNEEEQGEGKSVEEEEDGHNNDISGAAATTKGGGGTCTKEGGGALLRQCALGFHNTTRMTMTPSAAQVKRSLYTSSVGKAGKYREEDMRPLGRTLRCLMLEESN